MTGSRANLDCSLCRVAVPSSPTSTRAHNDFDFDHGRKMEHQASNPPVEPQPQPHTQPQNTLPPTHPQNPSLTASSTPVASPGLFSPSNPRTTMSLPPSQSVSEGTTPAALNSPFLHPLQNHRVREYVSTTFQDRQPCSLSLPSHRYTPWSRSRDLELPRPARPA